MATREYIGARYVPVFFENSETGDATWSNKVEYEPLTVVIHEGNSYTSKQYVPKGIDILNETYWVKSADYNAQVNAYRQEVTRYKEDVDAKFPIITDDIKDGAVTLEKTSKDISDYFQFDNEPTPNSSKGVTSGGVYDYLHSTTVPFVTPEMYGANPDDTTFDNSDAIQQAFDSDYSVMFFNKVYRTTKELIITKNKVYNGNNATIAYEGDGNAVTIDMSNTSKHYRDVCSFENFKITGPNSTALLCNNYAIKTSFRNLKLHNFKNYGLLVTGAGYECVYSNIYVAAIQLSNSIGFCGPFSDADFGYIYGLNCKTFFKNNGGGTNILGMHAWTAKSVALFGEPTPTDDEWNNWFAETVLIDVSGTNYAHYPTIYNYVYCDTYHTCIKWYTNNRNIYINYLHLERTTQLYDAATESDDKYSIEYLNINYLHGTGDSYSQLKTINYQPRVFYIEGEKYYPTMEQSFQIESNTVTFDIPFNKPKTFLLEVNNTGNSNIELRFSNTIISNAVVASKSYGTATSYIPFLDSKNLQYSVLIIPTGTNYIMFTAQGTQQSYANKCKYTKDDAQLISLLS